MPDTTRKLDRSSRGTAHRSRSASGIVGLAAAILALHAACSTPPPSSSTDPATDPGSTAAPPPPPPPCSNVAITATATAQSTYSFDVYSVAHLHDGDRNTTLGGPFSWVNSADTASGGILPQWVELDFAPAQAVSEVDLYTSAGYPIKEYDIQVPGGGGWTTVASVRGNTGLQIATAFPPVTTSQVRILTLRGPDIQPQYARINELEVYACPTSAPGRITGTISRFRGNGLPGIAVEAGGVTTMTDASGRYTIANLPYGQYTVHPSGGGFTFGSAQFQIDHNTALLSAAAPTAVVNAIGYNQNPIVYVHGWTDNRQRFIDHPSNDLAAAGYAPFFADLETSIAWTPPFATNVSHVVDAVNQAKYTTGQSKVILFAHSMGGLVARTYLETGRYNNDVSQFWSFGTPHLGTPAIETLLCLPNQPAVCEMTAPGMVLFNLTHWKRSGVDYHEIGGDSPLWTTRDLFCFRIFGHRWCVSIPWPDMTFRNALGWAMGILIGGPDDGLIGTCSAIGQPGSGIDRFVTQEVHTQVQGHRNYFDWDGAPSQQAYGNCVNRVLVNHSASTCGTRGLLAWGCVLSAGQVAALAARAPMASAAAVATAPDPAVSQRAAPQIGQITAGQVVTRAVVVEGGATTFTLGVPAGSAALTLVDPTGAVIDPAYVASISDTVDDPEGEVTSVVPSEAVTYDSSSGAAQYYVPNARPGTWKLVVTGGSDLPSGGATFTTGVMFDSSFTAQFSSSATFLTPGSTASFAIQLPSSPAVASATATMAVTLPDGTTAPLTTAGSGTSYTASFRVPSASGYARVTWSIVGQRSDGIAFERGGYQDVQITSAGLTWGGVTGESTVPRASDPSLAQSLVLQARVTSSFTGAGEVSADLVSSSGAVIAHAAQAVGLAAGANTVALTFSGDDIYAAATDGRYTLTNVNLVDTRSAAILGATVNGAYTTASYRAATFARTHGAPLVTTTGPYAVVTGDTLQLTANGVDPEGDALTYAWDLDGNGVFETAGRVVSYAAPGVSTPTSVTVSVRVTDPAGNAATAQTTIDISPNRVVNLALRATATASSTFSGYAASRVNDNDTSTALGGGSSWANNSVIDCTIPGCPQYGLLPATLDLDLGATRTLSHVAMYTTASYPIQDYDLELWDGTGWNVIDRIRGNTQPMVDHNFAPTAASKVRIVGYTGPSFQTLFVRVNELQVFGY